MTRRPAQLSDLRRIHRVPSIVTRTVGDTPDERLRLAREAQDLVRQHDVLHLVAAADVVDFAVAAAAQHEVDGRAVVEDVEPVAHVAAVTVERQRLVVDGVGDEERHDLLGILIRAEVVRRARDDHRHAVRAPVRQGEQVAAGLGCRVRIRRAQRILLGRRAVRDAAVDLVGADVQEARDPALAHGLQQREHAEDVGAQEAVRLHQRTIDMRLGGEVHDGVHAAQRLAHQRGVADIALHERVARVALDVGEIRGIAGVGELVEIDDAIVGVLAQHVTDEVAADEPRTPRDQQLHLSPASSPRRLCPRSPTADDPRRTSPAPARSAGR